jgi:hypothetical protein
MKNLIILTFFLFSIDCFSQSKLEIEKGSIQLTILDSTSVADAFNLLDRLTPNNSKWMDRYVVKDNSTYYRAGIGFFRKPHIYKIENGKFLRFIFDNKPTTIKRG